MKSDFHMACQISTSSTIKTIKILDENIFEYKLYFSESAQEKFFWLLNKAQILINKVIFLRGDILSV